MQLVWSRARPEWDRVFGGQPHTVGSLHMDNLSVVEELPQQRHAVDHPLHRAVPGHSVALAMT